MARKKLGEMLVEAGVLSEPGLRSALDEQRRWGGTLGRTLVEMKLVSEAELVRVAVAPAQPADGRSRSPSRSRRRSSISCPARSPSEHNLIPFAQPMKFLDVAMTDPTNLGILDELRIRTQLNIRPYLAGPQA